MQAICILKKKKIKKKGKKVRKKKIENGLHDV